MDGDAGPVEAEQDGLGLNAVDAEAAHVRSAAVGSWIADRLHAGDRYGSRLDLGHLLPGSGLLGGEGAGGNVGGHAEPDDPEEVLEAWSTATLLSTTGEQGSEGPALADHEA